LILPVLSRCSELGKDSKHCSLSDSTMVGEVILRSLFRIIPAQNLLTQLCLLGQVVSDCKHAKQEISCDRRGSAKRRAFGGEKSFYGSRHPWWRLTCSPDLCICRFDEVERDLARVRTRCSRELELLVGALGEEKLDSCCRDEGEQSARGWNIRRRLRTEGG